MLTKRFKVGVATTDIEPILPLQEYIDGFFIGLPITGNCRSNYIHLDYLEEFLEKCGNIPVWVTANSPVIMPNNEESTIDLLRCMYKKYKFHGYIVSDLVLLKALKELSIPVQVSTVSDIRDLNDISRYVELGFDDLVLSYKVNRNMDFINDAVKYFPNVKFTLIANELCESNCLYRMPHFICTSMNTNINYHCPIRTPEDTPERRLKLLQNTLIPPENLQYYPESIIFKLPTRMRTFNGSDIAKHLKMYAGLIPYKNIYKLVEHHVDISKLEKFKVSKDLFPNWLNCKNQCYKCGLCQDEVNKHIQRKALNLLTGDVVIEG